MKMPKHIEEQLDLLCTATINMRQADEYYSDYAKSVGELIQDIFREYKGEGRLAYKMNSHMALGATRNHNSDKNLYTWGWVWVPEKE